jgi:hypothetical protein
MFRRLKEWNKVLNVEGLVRTPLGDNKWISIFYTHDRSGQ